MQRASYASITCSMCALISHLKSMTCIYQASWTNNSRSLPMQVRLTGSFIYNRLQRFYWCSIRPPTLRCLIKLAAGKTNRSLTRTNEYICRNIYMHMCCSSSLESVASAPVPGLKSDVCGKLDRRNLFDHIQHCGYWQTPNASLLKENASL